MAPGPGTPLGRYLLVDRIGEGGMAEVFTAVSFGYGGFRRSFVIKRLRPELIANPTAIDLFIDEANLASTLVHPNVVPVFDFGEAAGSYFLAQEYVIGRDLGRITRRLRERGEPLLSANAILHLAHEVLARAAVRARQARRQRQPAGDRPPRHHARERHHLRARRGEGARLRHHEGHASRVADRERHGEGERRVHVARSRRAARPSTTAPICIRPGLVILYAATGEPTYPGETFYDLLTAAATGPGDEQLARIAALPAPLPAILGRALDVDPDRRFQSSAEFRAAVASA